MRAQVSLDFQWLSSTPQWGQTFLLGSCGAVRTSSKSWEIGEQREFQVKQQGILSSNSPGGCFMWGGIYIYISLAPHETGEKWVKHRLWYPWMKPSGVRTLSWQPTWNQKWLLNEGQQKLNKIQKCGVVSHVDKAGIKDETHLMKCLRVKKETNQSMNFHFFSIKFAWCPKGTHVKSICMLYMSTQTLHMLCVRVNLDAYEFITNNGS